MILPNDQEAEESVLGAILVSSKAATEVMGLLKPDDFYDSKNAQLFAMMQTMFADGEVIDAVSLRNRLRSAGASTDPLRLHELQQAVPNPRAVRNYAKVVLDTSRRRRLIVQAADIQEAAQRGDVDPATAVEQMVLTVTDRGDDNTVTLGRMVSQALDEFEQYAATGGAIRGVATGFKNLDRYLLGLQDGNFVIVAARPGVGKSSLVVNMARNLVMNDKRVVVFSLEMSAWEIGMRVLGAEARVDASRARSGRLRPDEWERLAKASETLSGAAMTVVDTGVLTVLDIRSRVRKMHAVEPIDLVIIDYLQLMTHHGRVDSRQQEVSDISRALKLFAKEMGIPVVAVSQLNRQVEARRDKKPMLSDLRESGSLEQDADVVMLLYPDEEDFSVVHVDIAKHQNGPTGHAKLFWQPHLMQFRDLALDNPVEAT